MTSYWSRISDWCSDVCSSDLLILSMILARGLAELHLRGCLVFPCGQNVAPLHLDRLAQPSRLVAGFRQRQQLGATQSYILSLPIALQTQEPRGPAALVHFQKQERKSVG